MSMHGDFRELQHIQKAITDMADGQAAEEVRKALADEALQLAKRSFAARRSPYGQPWRGNRGPVDLRATGALERSLRIELRYKGFVLVADGPFFKRSHGHDITEAVVHQWGGVVRARFRGSRSRSFRKRLAFIEQEKGKGAGDARARARGAKPMRFLVDGHWVSTYSFKLRSNPILPTSGRLPDAWGAALDRAARIAMDRFSKL